MKSGNVRTGGKNALEYKGEKRNLWENVRINHIVDIKGGVWCHKASPLSGPRS